MNTLKSKQEARGLIAVELDGLLAKLKDGSITAEERTKMNDLDSKLDQADADIAILAKSEQRSNRRVTPEGDSSEQKEMRKFSLNKVVLAISEGRSLDGLEKELVDESTKEVRELGGAAPKGVYLSSSILDALSHKKQMEARTMVVGTPSAGGFFVPTEKLGFFDSLFAKSVLDAVGVQKLTGLTAFTDLPGFSTAVTSSWVSETGTQNPDDATVVNRSLSPKLLSSATNISRQLMIQTNNTIESYILNNIMKSMYSALEAAVINGDGSNKPTGILGTANISTVSMGTNGAAPTLAKILELIQVVETANADTTNAKFLINPKLVAKLKQTVIDNGSGAMILAYNQYFGGVQNVIDGYPTFSTTNVPSNLNQGSSTGVSSSMIFGDFSQVVIGQFGGIELMVDTNSAAIARAGSIAITVNQYVDSALKQPSSIGTLTGCLTA
jgi:HK97 family phage major capsid protein